MRTIRTFLLTRGRLAFWLWCIPPILWLLSTLPGQPDLWQKISILLLTWTWMLCGAAFINFHAQWALRPALATLDNQCDPEPLLELCQTVCRQNPNSMLFQVYEGYALSLLGRTREATQVLDHVADHPRLAKNPSALLVWSAALPSGDPKQAWALERLNTLKSKMRPKQRALLDQVLNQRHSFALMQAAPPQLEPILQENLEQASCRREQVGAHMALATYYHQRQMWQKAHLHLEFVLENANKLAVRTQAEELMCKLPADL